MIKAKAKNGEVTMNVSGDLFDFSLDIISIFKATYDLLYAQNPHDAEFFKDYTTDIIINKFDECIRAENEAR